MSREQVILAPSTYAGAQESSPIELLPSESYARISVTRGAWNDTGADVLIFNQYVSLPGEDWMLWGGFTARGGELRTLSEDLVTEHNFVVSAAFPSPGTPGRRFMIRLFLPEALETSVSVELGDDPIPLQK